MKAAYIIITALLIVMLVASAFTVTAGDTTDQTTEPTKEPTKETTKPTEKPTEQPTPEPTTDPGPEEEYKQIVVYQGDTTIKDALINAKDDATAKSTLTSQTKAAFAAKASKGYNIPDATPDKGTSDTIKMKEWKCSKTECVFWIDATRNGKEIQISNPIHFPAPYPYHVVVSSIKDDVAKEETVTLKEDPIGALEQTIARHVASCPVGKGDTGTQPWEIPE